MAFGPGTRKKKVATTISVSSHFDETADVCDWHVAESHFLETWGDARAFDGTLSVIQPLIAPLYHTHSAREALAAFGDRSEEHTSELQSQSNLVCRLLLEKKKFALRRRLDILLAS